MTQRVSDQKLLELADKRTDEAAASYDLLTLRAAVRRWIAADDAAVKEPIGSGWFLEEAARAADALRAEMGIPFPGEKKP